MTRPSHPYRSTAFAAAAALAFCLAAAALATVAPLTQGRAAVDHLNFHEPTIRVFADAFPTPDLTDYWSATSPLYHLVLGAITRALDLNRFGMMVAGSLFTGLLVALVANATAARAGIRRAALLTLPLAVSLYVVQAGVYLLPDNAAWAGIVAVLLIALRPAFNPRLLLAAGLVLVLLVATRQIHIWAAAIVWAAAWIGPEADLPPQAFRGPRLLGETKALLLTNTPAKARRFAFALLATLPAFALLVLFTRLWGGLVPPKFQDMYHGWNPATPVFFLTIVGLYAPFYAGWIAPALLTLWRHNPRLVLAAAAAAAVLSFLPETTYDWDAGRLSGVWNLVRITSPELIVFGRTSLVLVVPTVIGAVSLLAVLSMCRRRDAWIYAAAVVAFIAAQTASPELWQRYHEPFILIILALVCAKAESHPMMSRRWISRWAKYVGPAALAAAFVALGVFTARHGRPVYEAKTGNIHAAIDPEPVKDLTLQYHPIDNPDIPADHNTPQHEDTP